jgi:hypothetical protein
VSDDPPHEVRQTLKYGATATGRWLASGLMDHFKKWVAKHIWELCTVALLGTVSADRLGNFFGRNAPPPAISQPRELPKASPGNSGITTGSISDQPKSAEQSKTPPRTKPAAKKAENPKTTELPTWEVWFRNLLSEFGIQPKP